MPAPRYLALDAQGRTVETVAASTGGAGDAEKVVSLDASGRLPLAMMPVGVGASTVTVNASEALAAGDFVNFHDSTGARVRKADATNGRAAHGFTLAAVASGSPATVFFGGENTANTGLTVGTEYFLGAAGAETATPTTTAGQILQRLGVAVSASSLLVEIQPPITRA